MFELAAPADPVAGRQLDLLGDLLLCLGDEGAEIAPANIRADDDAPLAVLAADLIGAGRCVDLCHRRKRHVTHLRQRRICPDGAHGCGLRLGLRLGQGNRKRLDGFDVGAQALGQANDNFEATVALEDVAGFLAANGDLDNRLNIRDADAVARQRRAG